MKEERYIRQTTLKGFGPGAQGRLRDSSILVVGLGGLGIPAVQYLNAMGIGTLGLVEKDVVDMTNLHRQVLYTEGDVGRPKLDVILEFLRAQNSETTLRPHDTFLTRENALDLIRPYDLVLDATDNFPSRYLINDACVILGKPFVYGALQGFEGQVSVFNFRQGPTYRCLFPNPPTLHEIPDCNRNGILGVLPGIIGNLQALEVVKVLTGIGEVLSGRLLLYDGQKQAMQQIRFPRRGEAAIRELKPHYGEPGCATASTVSMAELLNQIEEGKPMQIVDVREPDEFDAFHLSGALNLPLEVLTKGKHRFDPQKTVYLICATGIRSQAAIDWMHEHQPELTAYHVEGGIRKHNSLSP